MKRLIITALTIFSLVSSAFAGEGMWILSLIGKNYDQMKAAGFKLSPEDIYSLNQACLKDAVVVLNHDECTAEFVSNKGLLFTNYHCGYDDIQSQSSLLHNYIADGFWAKSLADELPIKGKTVSQLISIEDVTDKILTQQVLSLSPAAQASVIEGAIETMQDENTENGKYEVEVTNFFDGNYYYMFKYITYTDVRLVGAPPESLGQFGGETDNFVWPRQTADFCIFRVYTAPDGSPAEYNEKNIPLVPKKYLKINLKGVQPGDYAMTIGYPGETMRQYSSYGIDQMKRNQNGIVVEVFGAYLKSLKEFMEKDEQINIQYTAKYANYANGYKCYLGMNEGIDNLGVIDRKIANERQLTKWIADNKKTEYKKILPLLQKDFAATDLNDKYLTYWGTSIYHGCEFIDFASDHYMLYYYLSLNYDKKTKEEIEKLKDNYQSHFRDYNKNVDFALSKEMLQLYMKNVPQKYWPKGIGDADFFSALEVAFQNSIFTDITRYEEFIKKPKIETLNNDVLFLLTSEFIDIMDKFSTPDDVQAKMDYHKRLYTKAMMEMAKSINPDTLLYPDANSTMRLSYGKVGGYTYNGKDMGWQTNYESYLAKKNNDNKEFVVPEKMEQLYKKRDFGQYAENGTIPFNFLTDNDITGGNSGSPVLNGNGELIGLAFDGNWESMSGDVIFEPSLQRTIAVDIRYVLFLIDKFANAQNIIKELDIIK